MGAGAPLAGENKGAWPGSFVYSLPEHSTRFSLWGLLWIPMSLIAVYLLVRNLVATWPHVRLTALSAQTLLAIPLLCAILFGKLWRDAGLSPLTAGGITLVIGALLTVTLGARMLMGKTKRAPVYAKAKRREDLRVWNDGKGTIIDL